MKIKKSRSPLEQKLYHSFLLLSATIVLISLGFTLYFDISRQRKDMDRLISGTASYIASIPTVETMLENGYPNALVSEDLDSLSSNIPDINVIMICDKNGRRFYHTDRLKTGDSYISGDENNILSGTGPISLPGTAPTECSGVPFTISKTRMERLSALSWFPFLPPRYRHITGIFLLSTLGSF